MVQKQSHSPTGKKLSEFSKKVIALIRKIPKGRVASYSQIAKLADRPSSTRAVVWILHSCSKTHSLPWHRVLNAKGKIGFSAASRHFREQKRLLKNEGVGFLENDQIDLKSYQWSKKFAKKRRNRNLPQMFS